MKPSRQQLQEKIAEILKDMTSMWDIDVEQIGPATKLSADLGFSSIDVIHFMASIEMCFNRKLNYEEIVVRDGQYVDDLSVEELVDFISQNFDREPDSPAAI